MGDVERFPKPDVWFHDLYDGRGWRWKTVPFEVVHRDGWSAYLATAGGNVRCDAASPIPESFPRCGLTAGHDGPHLSARDDVVITSLCRVSSSASNGSVTRIPPQGSPAGPFEGAVGPAAWPHGRGPTPHQSQQRRGLTAAQEDHNQ